MAHSGVGGISLHVPGHHHRSCGVAGLPVVPGTDLRISGSGDLFWHPHEQLLRLVPRGTVTGGGFASPGPLVGAGEPGAASVAANPRDWTIGTGSLCLGTGLQPVGNLLDWGAAAGNGRRVAGGGVSRPGVVWEPPQIGVRHAGGR
jgi:hypothetical protein